MRGRFGRRWGRPLRRMLGGSIPPLLIRSNELLAAGEYGPAADGLEQLARAAEARGGRRAAGLYLEAGRARILASQPQQGVRLLESGLGLLAARGLSRRLARSGRRLVDELRALGHTKEADQIQAFLRPFVPDMQISEAEPTVAQAILPTHCPGCGAPVRPDEVEWLDQVTAECEYCGSPVRAE